MNKKGFTLVELLAVIVILGVILLIAVPKVISTINSSKLSTLEDTVKMIATSAEREYVSRATLDSLDQVGDPITCDDLVSLSSNDYSDCEISFAGDVAYVSLIGTGNFLGYSCTDGTKDDANCGQDIVNADISGANSPVLASNMIPVMYTNNKWVKADENNESGGDYIWYDYENKKWANVVVVTEATRNTYKTATAGTEVLMNDILAFFVWIPRYIYNIPLASHHTMVSGEIGIKFVNGTDDTIVGETLVNNNHVDDSKGTWTSHPAFTFNGINIRGLWVAKFETGYKDATTTVEAQQNVTTAGKFISKPSTYSWRSINLYNAFLVSRQLEDSGNSYGFVTSEVDTHMLKNTEWGLVSYLTLSKYGINGSMWLNNTSLMMTGCSGTSAILAPEATCVNAYETTNGQKASTTGNIYGIYDMFGGASEFTVGNLNNNLVTASSGMSTVYWDSVKSVYGDLYTTNLYTPAVKGDALYEVAMGGDMANIRFWSGSATYSSIITSMPWFIRGNEYRFAQSSTPTIYNGIMLVSGRSGALTTTTSFRVAIVNE